MVTVTATADADDPPANNSVTLRLDATVDDADGVHHHGRAGDYLGHAGG